MACYARQLLFALVTVLALGHLIAACGQKGPLNLPNGADSGQQETGAPD